MKTLNKIIWSAVAIISLFLLAQLLMSLIASFAFHLTWTPDFIIRLYNTFPKLDFIRKIIAATFIFFSVFIPKIKTLV